MEEKTPLMQQYADIKNQHQDALLFFQVGDFYELFYDDAVIASKALGITLTSRGKPKNGISIPLCGVPVHTVEFYLKKLLELGFKIALCDQLSEAQPGIISKRGVVRIFTPGTLIDSVLLREKSPSYLLSVVGKQDFLGISVVELLMGTIQCTMIPRSAIRLFESELARFSPDEIIIAPDLEFESQFLKERNFFVSLYSNGDNASIRKWFFENKACFPEKCINECSIAESLIQLYSYLQYTNVKSLDQSYSVSFYEPEEYLVLDAETQRNLVLVATSNDKKNSLFSVLDNCVTAMGSRLLKKWLLFPLKQCNAIERRLRVVNYFFQNYSMLLRLRDVLGCVGDFERIIGRVALGRASLADYRSIADVLVYIPQFFDCIEGICQLESIISTSRVQQCRQLQNLLHLLDVSLNRDNTSTYIIKQGYNTQLDELRHFTQDIRKSILALEEQEQKNTGISTLKIRHSGLHGYYIEVTKTHTQKIPQTFTRLQTLSGKERYTNDALRILAHNIEQATMNLSVLEEEVFQAVKQETFGYFSLLRQLSFLFSYFDVVTTYAYNAHEYSYVLPQMNQERAISIVAGRHPVVERIGQKKFVSNSTNLSDDEFFLILTGPNMGGKSTYLRQVALICLMAHIGSFVPAESAQIMVLDRIFTRIGAGDNLAEGKSTFLVEMEEAATICHYATCKSLVILDEVGRGTSTREGIAIAQAILEFLCTHTKARCLFATHYQELALLENKHKEIASYCVESREVSGNIVFLHTIAPGIANRSFGIEVAKMAKLPGAIIDRATELLSCQAVYPKNVDFNGNNDEKIARLEYEIKQLEKRFKAIKEVDLDSLTPKQALDLLFKVHSFYV